MPSEVISDWKHCSVADAVATAAERQLWRQQLAKVSGMPDEDDCQHGGTERGGAEYNLERRIANGQIVKALDNSLQSLGRDIESFRRSTPAPLASGEKRYFIEKQRLPAPACTEGRAGRVCVEDAATKKRRLELPATWRDAR